MVVAHGVNYLYSISGFIVGLLVGFTGVGGGSLMTPLLVLMFGFSPSVAVGTDLLYASITKASGTAVHGFNRTIDWRIVGWLASGSLPAAFVTLFGLHYFGVKSPGTASVITTVLGVALILTAVALLFRKTLQARLSGPMEKAGETQITVLTVVLGAFLGFLISITSVGAGAIGATVLILLYPKLPIARIVGSDIAHAVPLTLIAGIGHWFLGSIDWWLLLSLLIGSIPGIIIGSHFAAYVPDRLLRIALACVLALVGAKLAI
ncbi:MAG TPA: sulfite exporter TauE/SafE family protein [Methylovirgula sp.]